MRHLCTAPLFTLGFLPLCLIALLLLLLSTPASAQVDTKSTILRSSPVVISPNGRWEAASSVPSGSETAHLAKIRIVDRESGVTIARIDGHSPRWSVDGHTLFFQRSGVTGRVSTFRYDLATDQIQPVSEVAAALLPNDLLLLDDLKSERYRQASALPQQLPPLDQNFVLTYPTSIRVLHHPQNGCRAVDDWQIDTIPFEEYVARAIPAEVPASWPAAALKAQAVAARSYAWRQILVGRPAYDLTDWANFQMMCDLRLPSTDAAVAQTAGEYLSAKDDPLHLPIVAMYSAENGHPTLENPSVSYLQAVPDLFSLGKARWGHGYGLSQWGAQRRALAGHGYRQILAHYYRGVHLQNALEISTPIGTLPRPQAGLYLSRGGFSWDALTSAEAQSVSVTIEGVRPFSTTQQTEPLSITESITLSGATGFWRAPPHLAEQDRLTATLWVGTQRQEAITLTVDRSAPAAPIVLWPEAITQSNFALDVAATEREITLGLSQEWLWEGEALSHTVESGRVISELAAYNGSAWSAVAGRDRAGVWYGPYTDELPPGFRYRALFWLRVGLPTGLVAEELTAASIRATLPLTSVARLDVAGQRGETVLGLRDLWLSDFSAASVGNPLPEFNGTLAGVDAFEPDAFEPIAVDFYLFDGLEGIEFRVAWPGLIDLTFDRVELWLLPDPKWRDAQEVQWQWRSRAYTTALPLAAVTFDQAGNVSPPNRQRVEVRDETPPQFGAVADGALWLSQNGGRVQIDVVDDLSGLDINSGSFAIEGESFYGEGEAIFVNADDPWARQSAVAEIDPLPPGFYSISFRVADMADNVAQSEKIRIRVSNGQIYLPLVQLQ